MHKLTTRGWVTQVGRSHCLSESGEDKAQELVATRRTAIEGFIAGLPAEQRNDLAVALRNVRPQD